LLDSTTYSSNGLLGVVVNAEKSRDKFLKSITLIFNKTLHEEFKKSDVFISMSSWYDVPVSIYLRMTKRKVYRVIHDFERHKGDKLLQAPPIFLQVLLSTDLIAMSRYTQKRINPRGKPLHFRDYLSILPQVVESANTKKHSILFLGRIRRYKGLSLLLESLEFVDKEHTLVIAGQGNLDNMQIPKNAQIYNYFLTEEEIDNQLALAEIVVFPYLEASQSGLIPRAMQYGKKILVTNVGALPEQVENYKLAKIAEPNAKDIAIQITRMLD
jgi:glycosyltransferase involved in cell wall biosynthesis